MKSIRLLILLSLVFNACASIPKPDVDGCIINAAVDNNHVPARKCYNFSTDFEDNGNLKPGAVAKYFPNPDVADLNKAFVLDIDDQTLANHYEEALARLKAYIKQLRTEYDKCNSGGKAK